MGTHVSYLDEALHDVWIPLPPPTKDDGVVLQCHRDGGGRRSYFRITLTGSAVESWSDPDRKNGMQIHVVSRSGQTVCLQGVEGGELRISSPASIRHVETGSVPRRREWGRLLKFQFPVATPVPTADEVVPLA